jgi:cytochrome c oxidase subunit 3
MDGTFESSPTKVELSEVDEYAPPAGATEFALWMGVAVIGVMFAAGCIAYAMVRQHATIPVDVPLIFWISTAVLNISSVTLFYALISSKADHRTATRRGIDITALLGLAFLILQIPGLRQILAAHEQAIELGVGVYAAMLILIALHAAHVVVGMIATLVVTRRIHRIRSTTHTPSLRLLSIYWHGLTVIWMVLFSLMLIVR